MGKFELINPIIGGNIDTTFEGKNSSEAAQNFWEMLTSEKKLLVNELAHFMFTMRGGNGKLHHFSIHEKVDENKKVQYSLEDVTESVEKSANKNLMNKFLKEVEKEKSKLGQESLTGGKKKRNRNKDKDDKDDSSSTSDSDSESDDEFDFGRLRRKMYGSPISYWWYSPLIYRVRRVFTPVFVRPLAPYVRMWLPMR